MAAYYASKAYVLSFSEALASELAPLGIGVSVLCPGPTRTGFQQRAKMERSRLNKLLAASTRLAPRRLLPFIVLHLQKPHDDRS